LVAIKTRHLDATRVLFEHKANINARDTNGDTALHHACAWPAPQYIAVQWLVENGADVNASNNDGMTPETGHTPLFEAAASYDYRLTAYLLAAGANPNALTPDGSPLHRTAGACGYLYTPDTFQKFGGNVVALLLEKGADPNLAEQFEGKTPLHAAAGFSHPSESVNERYLGIVTLLLAHGADPSARDQEGKMPLDYAEKNGHSRIANVLRQALLRKPETTLQGKTLLRH
jgi:ankyrin repeat protein